MMTEFSRLLPMSRRLAIIALVLTSLGAVRDEDCNGNGGSDTQDIASGYSEDCNLNGIPDECEAPRARLDSELPFDSEFFGQAVGMTGEHLLVGAPGNPTNGIGAGAVYPFVYDAPYWTPRGVIQPMDGQAGDMFGYSVDVDGDTAIVGAPGREDVGGYEGGAAYILQYNGAWWVQVATLHPDSVHAGDAFGNAVAIDGDVAAVSAPGNDDVGSVFVYRYNGISWVEDATIHDSSIELNVGIGRSLDIEGNLIAVAATDSDVASLAGDICMFRHDGVEWVHEVMLHHLDDGGLDRFGHALVLRGDTLVAGASDKDGYYQHSGSAYVFRFDGMFWRQEAKLVADDGAYQDHFGYAVAMDGDTVVIGAPDVDDVASDGGAAYVYVYDGVNWSQQRKILPVTATVGAKFGTAVVIDGATVAAGAPGDDSLANDAGFVDVVDLTVGDCNNNGIIDTCDILAGTSEDCTGNGIPDECEPDCNANGVPDSCDIAAQTEDDCNANGIPDACDLEAGTSLDCNGNDSPDECDVLDGVSPDCNGNGTPDECDLAAGTSVDCNNNQVPDHCDVLYGTSLDCNGNGLPDECDLTLTHVRHLPLDGRARGEFGIAVAIDAGTAVVGAQGDDDNGAAAGAAYVMSFNGVDWDEQAKLFPTDARQDQRFGNAVAIDGDVIVVGAQLDDSAGLGTGAAYVFRRYGRNWVEEAKLVADDGAYQDYFGCAVAISGDTIVVGAELDDDPNLVLDPSNSEEGIDWGAVCVFEFDGTTWAQVAKLQVAAPTNLMRFGRSVALDGHTLLAGARPDVDDSPYSYDFRGAVYAFEHDGGAWIEQQKIEPVVPVDGDYFGLALDLSGDVAVIGALGDSGDPNAPQAGAAYVFRYATSTWVEEVKLRPAELVANDHFGFAVAIEGDTAIIGAPGNDRHGISSGTAYVYRESGGAWNEFARCQYADAVGHKHFGRALAISGHQFVTGALGVDDPDQDAGAAYFYRLDDDCNDNMMPDECEVAGGTATDVNRSGQLDECETVGDANCDGSVDVFDIDAFVMAILSPPRYAQQYPECELLNSDCDGDGEADVFDIDAFIVLITAG